MKSRLLIAIVVSVVVFSFAPQSSAQTPTVPLGGSKLDSGESVVAPARKLAPEFYSLYTGPTGAFTELGAISTRTGFESFVSTLGDLGPWPGPTPPQSPDSFVLPSPFGLAFDVDGSIYAIVSWLDLGTDTLLPAPGWSRLAKVDEGTGAVTYLGAPIPLHFAGPDMDACGNLYATGFTVGAPETYDPTMGTFNPPYIFGDSYLHRIDKYTGADTTVGDTGKTHWMDLAFDSEGRLWATTENELWQLDTETGAATFITPIYGVPQYDIPGVDPADWGWMEVMSIAFDEHDNLWGTAIKGFSPDLGNSPVLEIDTHTGATTLVGYTDKPFNHGGDFRPAKVTVCHRKKGRYDTIRIDLDDLPAHRAHGDIVPGTDGYGCECPAGNARID